MRKYGSWKVAIPGEEWLFEPDEMLGSEWYAIESDTGLDFDEWLRAIDKRSWIACQALVWFLRYKAGTPQGERYEVDFKLRQLITEEVPDPKADTGMPEDASSSPPSADTASDPTT